MNYVCSLHRFNAAIKIVLWDPQRRGLRHVIPTRDIHRTKKQFGNGLVFFIGSDQESQEDELGLSGLDLAGSHSPHLAPGASLCPKVPGSQKVRASDMRGLAPKIQLGMIHKIGAGSVIVTNINKPK